MCGFNRTGFGSGLRPGRTVRITRLQRLGMSLKRVSVVRLGGYVSMNALYGAFWGAVDPSLVKMES